MGRTLSIGDVAKRTGLTERTLRFYEEEGLIRPSRSPGGRRMYSADELTALHQITVLKRAGFPLSRIKQLIRAAGFDGAQIIAAQMAALDAERSVIDNALAALARAKDAIAAKQALDIESLCNLIQLGEQQMKSEALKDYIDRHFTPEEQQQWKNAKLQAAGGDPDGWVKRWNDLIARIERALPLDPASRTAQDLLAEWNALLRPFIDALDDQMKEQVRRAPSVPGLDPIVRKEIREFVKAANAAAAAN